MVHSKDKSTKSPKKIMETRSKKDNKRLKKGDSSDSSDNDDDMSTHSDSESEEEMDMHEYRKFVQKIFPSKYLKNKIKQGEKDTDKNSKVKTKTKKSKIVDEEESEKPKSKKNKKSKVKVIEESEEEEDDESEYETVDEEDSEDEEIIAGKKGINIIFTIGDPLRDEDDSEYDDEDDSDYLDESEDEEEEEEEDEEEDDEEDDAEDDEEKPKKKKNKEEDLEKQQETINEVRKTFEIILEKDKSNKIALDGLKELEQKEKALKKSQEKKLKGTKLKNVKKFKNLINKKSLMNDYKYFKDKLSVEEQEKIINEVEELNKYSIVQKPYRLTLLESTIPTNLKSIALNKIASLRYMDPGNGEYYKIKTWVDTFMQIPFNNYKSLPITIDNGVEECQSYMEKSKSMLDEAVYGLNDAKMQIMQLIGQWISNPKAVGTAIAIKGPMGTGKTTLVKEGISKILNREFAFIALGGATDSSFLEGHGYTYEGSTWGKIVDILVKTKSMNPVIYFDELDKISETPKGEEIAGILTHLTDTSQNSEFHDKYFSEIDFDLSKCLFIFSYNDESRVNPILLDRMYKIQTQGYEKKDKRVISNQYLIPKIKEQVNFKEDEIIIPDETIDYIVETYTEKEKGVRNLKRCLEIIYTKLNLYRLMKPDSKLFENETTLAVEFPFTVTSETVRKLIKKEEANMSLAGLYI
jgi:ATP-dependent Lon protease